MKKILNICLAILTIVAVAGCSNDDTPSGELMIVKADLAMKAVGGNGSVQYTSTAGEVSATSSADWCKVIDVTNNQVNISVNVNTGYEGRTAQLVLTNGISTQLLTVIQEGAIWAYDKNDTEFRVGDEIGEIPIIMSSNLAIEVDIPEIASNWLSFKLTDVGLKLMVEKNGTGEIRGAFVTVKTGVRKTIYSILQYEVGDLLGSWKGEYVSVFDNKRYGLSDVTIGGPLTNGLFTVTGLIDGAAIPVQAIYSNGIFVIPGQYVGQIGPSAYLYFGLLNPGTQIFWATNQYIGLVPMIMEDGTIILNFTDVGGLQGGEAAGFLFGIFPTKSTTVGKVQYVEAYLNCLLYKARANN